MNVFPDNDQLTCVHALDGTILEVNAAAGEVLGMDPGALVGAKIQDFLNPAGCAGFMDYINRTTRDGVAEGTMVVQAADGTLRTLRYDNALHRRGTRSVVHGRACDITDPEVMIEALRQSEAYFRSIIENVSDVIALIGPRGRLRYVSPSARPVLGYSPHELNGRRIFDFIHPDDRERAAGFLEGLESPTGTIEIRLRHADGSLRFVEVVARNAIRGTHMTSVIATVRDVTERRGLQTQLETAKRMASLGHLAATVAHEFNNVLMSIQPFADLLQRPSVSRETILKSAGYISNSIARGKRIAQEILRYTQPAEPALVALNVEEWWDGLYPELAGVIADSIEIVTDFDPRLYILADPSQLAQVFVNLLTNARDAMPHGGTITIRARRDDLVHFSVTDTGCGMPPEMLQQIFVPLFTSKSRGTGLGLAVTHQVVQGHNGHIQVESVVGRGTTFHLFLPAAEAPDERTEAGPEPARVRPRRLLMVEDEPMIMEGVVQLLRDAQMDVSGVMTGEEAVDAVEALEPDIVLLDFGLPGIDGLETCRRIRARRPDLPVIFSSGHGTEQQLAAHIDDARTRYLQKPFAIRALLDAIASFEGKS